MQGFGSVPRRSVSKCVLAIAILVACVVPAAAAAAPSPVWSVDYRNTPTNLSPGGSAKFEALIDNVGRAASTGSISATVTLPPGATATEAGDGYSWECPGAAGATVVVCATNVANYPSADPNLPFSSRVPPLVVSAAIDPSASGSGESTVVVSGGGASRAASSNIVSTFSADPAEFGLHAFTGSMRDEEGNPSTQAGSRVDYTTEVVFPSLLEGSGLASTTGNVKDANVSLPLGLVGNPTAIPTCEAVLMAGRAGSLCPADTQVGTAVLTLSYGFPIDAAGIPAVYNVEPPPGVAARFAFNIFGVVTNIDAKVRPDDHGIEAKIRDASQTLALLGTTVTLWGVPADPSHDASRREPSGSLGAPSTAPQLPFMTAPTSCSGQALTTRADVNSWQRPSVHSGGSFDADPSGNPITMTGCDRLDFSPTLEARPTTNLADSPSGLDARVHVPQNNDPDGLAEAHLRDATVTLPAGMTVNASSANGLGACSPAQVGLTTPVGQARAIFDEAAVSCPDDSKLGTVQLDTPLLDHPLKGAVYLATQGQNPFNSLLALYIAVEDPESGVTLKLAGHPVADQQSGQLTVSFDQNPQLPFEDLRVNLFTGPRAALKTPMACGNFTTTSTMIPWSSPEGAAATPSDTFAITRGAGDSACLRSEAEAPNKPAFNAGTADPAASAYSPFSLRIVRADGTAPLKAIDATLPKGLLGKLAGIPYCSESALGTAAGKSGRDEQSSSSCPAASQVGSVNVGAGAGSTPLNVPGKAYLAGPYKGAPLSLAIVTPAVAGPFDLGTVVVRTRLEVNPETAQIHAVSDQLPTILQGIPLDIRSIAVNLDKPSFTLNPTDCDPMSIDGSALSVFGQSASFSNRFQVGGCGALKFKPSLAFKLSGPTRRNAFPALRAILTARPGDANIGRAQVTLPKTQFLAQAHIRTICTRVQYAAKACPPGSVYGKARAWSPLLDQPLSGPVYLRSSSNPLPDLVASLDGQIHLDLVGRIDSVNARLRSTFEAVPDAPVSKFVLEMQGGKKGLLVNNTNLCKAKPKADVQLDAQSGKAYDFNPLVKADCGKFKKKSKHKKSGQSKPHKKG